MKNFIWFRNVGRQLNIRLSGVLHFSKTILQILWTMLWVKTLLYVYLLRDEGREVFLRDWPFPNRVGVVNMYLLTILVGILIIEAIFFILRFVLRRSRTRRLLARWRGGADGGEAEVLKPSRPARLLVPLLCHYFDMPWDAPKHFAKELYEAGLLSEDGLRAVEQRANIPQGLKL